MQISLALSLTNPLITGGGIPSLHSWFADGGDGLLFDFTKTDRFFQENTGPTLADDVGEAIGLSLDQHSWGGKTLAQVLAAATELSTNGGFDADASWTKGTGWSISGGKATHAAGTGSDITQAGILTPGNTYKLLLDVTAVRAQSLLYVLAKNPAGGDQYVTIDAVLTVGQKTVFFQAPSTGGLTIRLGLAADADIDNVSCKLAPGNHGVQSSAPLKPTRQTSGAKYDGNDDNTPTPYLAGSGANSIVALVTVPASLGAIQRIAGASDNAGANRCQIGINTSGQVIGGAGDMFYDTVVGTADLRGTETVIGMSMSGGTVKLFAGAALECSVSYTGAPTTTVPFRLGAFNANGVATSFFGGSIKKLMTLRKAITLADYLKIRARMLID